MPSGSGGLWAMNPHLLMVYIPCKTEGSFMNQRSPDKTDTNCHFISPEKTQEKQSQMVEGRHRWLHGTTLGLDVLLYNSPCLCVHPNLLQKKRKEAMMKNTALCPGSSPEKRAESLEDLIMCSVTYYVCFYLHF